jgi:hypothetical protein
MIEKLALVINIALIISGLFVVYAGAIMLMTFAWHMFALSLVIFVALFGVMFIVGIWS